MAIEAKCPNGHQIRAKSKYAGHTVACPACQAPVKLPASEDTSLEEDGALKIQASDTKSINVSPSAKAESKKHPVVPVASSAIPSATASPIASGAKKKATGGALDDDAILDFLGPPPAAPIEQPVHQLPGGAGSDTSVGSSMAAAGVLRRGMKKCPKCGKDVRATYDACPYCRTYFTDPAEIARRLGIKCSKCGNDVAITDNRCRSCGNDLRAKK